MWIEVLKTQGEHAIDLPGRVGRLEGIVSVPEGRLESVVAMLGHPHSLQGGSMNNKVVTTLARAFHALGIASLRYNFRGVGLSEGTYDAGIGEGDDMISLACMLQDANPSTQLILAGFSFGSYVAYRAAAVLKPSLLVTVAPPVHHYDYNEYKPAPNPWVILQGDEDELIPLSLITTFANENNPPLPLIHFPGASHFFHGQLLPLKAQTMDVVRERVLGH